MHAARYILLHNCVAGNRGDILGEMTEDTIVRMAARKSNVIQLDHTAAAILSASWLLAQVTARTMEALTLLWACEDLVHAF